MNKTYVIIGSNEFGEEAVLGAYADLKNANKAYANLYKKGQYIGMDEFRIETLFLDTMFFD